MTINTKDLPSKAILGEKLIEIPTITLGVFSQFADLPSSTVAERMLKDLTIYIQALPNWEDLCAYDYCALIYLIKSNSLLNPKQQRFTVRCPNCGKENLVQADLSQTMEFTDLPQELLRIKSVTLHGITVEKIVPTMQELCDALKLFVQHGEDVTQEDIMMRVFFNFAENPNAISSAIFNTTKEEAAKVQYLRDLCSGLATYKNGVICSKCKEVITVARSDFFASDPFRNIFLNYPLQKDAFDDSSNVSS